MGGALQPRSPQPVLPPEGKPGIGEGGQYLAFELRGESFAIDILRVREIIEYVQPTTIPMMPVFVRGVINLRGNVVPVIDLGRRFGRGGTEVRKRTCIVIVEVDGNDGGQHIGILVDAVNEVLEFAPEKIEAAPAFGAGLRQDFICGMGRVEGGFIILLNVSRALSVEEMAALARLTESDAPEGGGTSV